MERGDELCGHTWYMGRIYEERLANFHLRN